MQKNKILITLARFPYPITDGTRYRILENLCAALLPLYEIEFLILSNNKIKPAVIHEFESLYGKVHFFYIPKAFFTFKAFHGLIFGEPLQVAGFYKSDAQEWLNKNYQNYSVVYVHTIRAAKYFLKYPNNRIIFDFNDAISLNYQGAKKTSKFPMSLIYQIEENRVRIFEKKVLNTFAHFNVVSMNDRVYLESLNNKQYDNFATIGYSIDRKQLAFDENRSGIYFVGNLDYDMNTQAVDFMLSEIWPKLRQLNPAVVLYLIGNGADKLRRKYKSDDRVIFTGFVEDLSFYIKKCFALVAPLVSGAGIPTKIIEAMAYGIPVITSQLGVRGMGSIVSSENLIVLPMKGEDWAASICDLSFDKGKQALLSSNGRKLFEEKYSMDAIKQDWLELFEKVSRGK